MFLKLLLWLTGLAIVFFPTPAHADSPGQHMFHLDASSFAYAPSQIRVNAGDDVTIELTSTDVVHGLYLDNYGISVQADPGQSASVTFTADRPGKFRFRCNVTCGAMHPFMIGTLSVGPRFEFWRAAALAVLAGVAALAWRGQ